MLWYVVRSRPRGLHVQNEPPADHEDIKARFHSHNEGLEYIKAHVESWQRRRAAYALGALAIILIVLGLVW